MGAEDITKKAEDLAKQAGEFVKDNADKIQDALKSEQAEGISDKILGGAADLANKVTGGKFADQVEDVRANLDKQIGNE
ncbi:MAG: antitoxin [Leucobacter sp.]|nr:antitoxin [Leucobacter sp.]